MSTPTNPRGATIFKPSRWLNRATRTLAAATVAALIATLAPADAAIGSAAAPAPADSETVESPSNSASDSWSEDDICFQDWGYCEDFMPLEVITEPAMPHTGSILAGTSIKPNLGTWKYAASIDAHWRLDDDWLAYTRWNSGQSFSDLPSVEIPNDAAGSNLYVEISISGKYSGEEYREYDLGNVGALAFINSPKPIIQGLPQVGQSLSVSQSAWNPQATYQYQWLRNGKNISGATKETYQLVSADSGHTVSIAVIGSRTSYAPKTMVSTGVKISHGAFSQTSVPTISGSSTVGKTLTAKAGTWSPSATLNFQWKRDGKNISGATRSTYTLIGADAGRNISVTVTGSKANYASVAKTSKSLKIKVGAFSKASVPSISGSAKVGSKLTAKTETWSPKASFGYQWYRGNAKIKGATKSTYTPVAADNGKFLKVSVTGKSQGYKDVTKTSKTKKITTGTITPSSKLKISGNAQYGKTISASVKLPSGTKSTYQWYKNGKKIKGATKKSYKLGAKDIGAKYQVRMTVTKAGFKKLDLSSNTLKVGKATFSVKANPTVSGSRKSGSTLKATGGSFAPSPSTRSYQWLRNGKAIKGATRSSYKLTNSDSGTKISVQVTAKKANYTSKSAKSSSVDIARILKTVISKDGTYKVGSKLKPGLYKATGSGNSCYWERLNGFSGSLDDINSNYIGTANTYVRITSYDEGFKTSRCGSWKQVSSSGAKATTIKKNGTYRVGIDIKPGLYKGTSSDSCYWETLYDFTGDFYDIIENDFSYDRYIYVDIPSDAKGFKKNGCGTLKRIG